MFPRERCRHADGTPRQEYPSEKNPARYRLKPCPMLMSDRASFATSRLRYWASRGHIKLPCPRPRGSRETIIDPPKARPPGMLRSLSMEFPHRPFSQLQHTCEMRIFPRTSHVRRKSRGQPIEKHTVCTESRYSKKNTGGSPGMLLIRHRNHLGRTVDTAASPF